MGSVRELFFLYFIDMLTPGAEMFLLLAAARQGVSSGVGAISGLVLVALLYKILGAFGVVALEAFLGEAIRFVRFFGACVFCLFSGYLLCMAYRYAPEKEERSLQGFWVWFVCASVGSVFNPFSLLATLSLISVTITFSLTLSDALKIAFGMAGSYLLWNVVLLCVGRKLWVVLMARPNVVRGIYVFSSVVFAIYSVRFFLIVC